MALTISGTPAVAIVAVSNTLVTNTGNLTENTVLTLTIPANSIGINGSFHITALWSMTNNANAKTARIKFGGTTVVTNTLTVSALFMNTYTIIRNRNSLSSQVSGSSTSNANTTFNNGSSSGVATYAFNTGAAITMTVTLQNGVGTDTLGLEAIEVIAFP